jgi:hypothetical protein
MVQPLEVVSGYGHAGFDINGKQQPPFTSLAGATGLLDEAFKKSYWVGWDTLHGHIF